MGNQSYTWSNMQSNPSLTKLDRFLISADWDQHFPLTKVLALPRITSDHSPILLSTSKRKVHRQFRFEKVWLFRGDFCALVHVWWSEVQPKRTSVLTFVAKLRHCRKRIKEWCSTNFYNVSKTRKELSEDIQKLDTLEEFGCLTPLQLEARKLLKSKLSTVLTNEEVMWKSRARQQWLKEGDGNTKFFHAVANGRRRVNSILEIEDEGNLITREEDKLDYFYKSFKDIFAPDAASGSTIGDWSWETTSRLRAALLTLLL